MLERNENNTKPYTKMSTLELARQLTIGPEGKFKGSTADRFREELPIGLKGAAEYVIYKAAFYRHPKLIKKLPPKMAERFSELHSYFGPEVKPAPDISDQYNDPAIFRRHKRFERDAAVENLEENGVETIEEEQVLIMLWTLGLRNVQNTNSNELR